MSPRAQRLLQAFDFITHDPNFQTRHHAYSANNGSHICSDKHHHYKDISPAEAENITGSISSSSNIHSLTFHLHSYQQRTFAQQLPLCGSGLRPRLANTCKRILKKHLSAPLPISSLFFFFSPPTRCHFHKLWREAIFGLSEGREGGESGDALFSTHESSTLIQVHFNALCMLMAIY